MSENETGKSSGLLSFLVNPFKNKDSNANPGDEAVRLYAAHPMQSKINALRDQAFGHASFGDLKKALLEDAKSSTMLNLCGANLQGFSAICGNDWDDVIMEGADISYGSVELTAGKELEMVGMNAAYCDIISPEAATLKAERSCLVGARLRGENVGEGATFGRLELNDSDARAADISGARVYQIEARGADMSGVNFSGATLTGDLSSWG